MPTDANWFVITIPRKEYERDSKAKNAMNNLNTTSSDDFIAKHKRQKYQDNSFEKILSDTLDELQIEDVVWLPTRNGNFYQVTFQCELFETDSILATMKVKGIGTKPDTSIGYIPFNLFFYDDNSDSDGGDTFDSNDGVPNENGGKKLNFGKKQVNVFKDVTNDFLKSVTSRLTVAQVVEGVRSGAEITFDFSVYTLMAAFIAAFAIFANDPVNIAASMMIEPVMGTVMAMTFGLVIEDKKLFWLGVRNNIISLMMCLIPGYIIGLIFLIWMTEWNPPPAGLWPAPQMQNRGTYEGIIYGALIALPCGGAVAVSLLNSNYGALVGVAVASTFQPPFVNTGLLWALSTHLQIKGHKQDTVPYNISGEIYYMKPAWAPQNGYSPVYSYDMRMENVLLGCVSMALTGVNIVCMLIVAFITLKIKEVMPLNKLEQISPGSQRFFKKDLKLAREYNRQKSNVEQDLGKQILEEWAEIAGIDKNKFLNSSRESRVTQLQTLYDIIKDVESDETYKHVMENSKGNASNNRGLVRRLTQPLIHSYSDPSGQIHRDSAVWNVEQEIGRALNDRNYNMNHSGQPDIANGQDDQSPYSTIGSIRGVRQLAAERRRRKSSQLLRGSLRYSTRSPYSVWPGGRPQSHRNDSIDMYAGVRQRPNYPSRFETESTGF